jgi:hypothetical protein
MFKQPGKCNNINIFLNLLSGYPAKITKFIIIAKKFFKLNTSDYIRCD